MCVVAQRSLGAHRLPDAESEVQWPQLMDALAAYALPRQNVFATIESGMTAVDKDAFIQCDNKLEFFLLCHVKFAECKEMDFISW